MYKLIYEWLITKNPSQQKRTILPEMILKDKLELEGSNF